MLSAVLAAQRRQQVLRAVRSGTTQVAELAVAFGVSEMTVRRDLRDLERDGKLMRVHGGAMSVMAEPSFAEIEVERAAVKDAIGAAAAALVDDGQTIVLDIGTTTLALARHLRGRTVTVITSEPRRLRGAADRGVGRARAAGRRRAPQLPLAGRRAGRGRAAPAARRRRVPGRQRDRRAPRHPRHDDGGGPDQARDDRRRERCVLLADSAKFGMRGVVRVCGPSGCDTW